MHLVRDRDILNQYETPYGAIALKTRLISYDNGDNVKIKYELYDGTNLISQVYVMLNYLILRTKMKILKFLSNRIVVSIILICVQILWLALFMRYIFTDATLLKGVFIF